MPNVTPFFLAYAGAFLIGAIIVVWCLATLSNRHLHTRQGAVVLIAAALTLGLFIMSASVIAVVIG